MTEEKPFRVLLDLSELNLTVSKYMWMNVSPREFNNIGDFKIAVLKKLNFDKRDIKLYVHDGLLPEDEKIIVLRENDTVKIQYVAHSNEVNYNSSICEFNSSEILNSVRNSDEGIEKGVSRKRKRKSDISEAVEGNNESFHKSNIKKKKHKRSHSLSTSENKASNLISSEEIIPEVANEFEKEDILVESHVQNDGNTYNLSTNECDLQVSFDSAKDVLVAQGNNCKKRKRKRHKKRKNVPVVAIESLVPADLSSVPNTTSTFTDQFSSVRKHIKFTSPAPSFDAANEENVEVIDLNSYVKNFKAKNSLNTSENAYKTPESPMNKTMLSLKNSTPSSQTSLKQSSWSVSPMQNESSIEIEQPSNVEKNETASIKKNLKLSYTSYPMLNCLPTVGSHIAFKTLELDENYSPSVTPYKEGIIQCIDPVTEALEIELINEEIKPGRAGKFENLAMDELPSAQIIKNVTLNWSSLIEPRCVTD